MEPNSEEPVKIDQESRPPGQIDCTIIRHAQALVKAKKTEAREKNQAYCVKNEDFWKDPFYIDNGLTEVGIQQCFEVKNQFQNQLQVVFVSPLERTLQTANLMFGDIKDIKIIVRPNLTELVKSVVGISKSIADKKQKYPNMDFSAFANRQVDWQADILSEEYASGARKLLTEDSKKSEQLITDYYFNLVKHTYPTAIEDRDSHKKRVLNQFQQIKDICHKNKYNNIAIVTHNQNIKYMNECISGQYLKKFGNASLLHVKI